MRSDFDHQQMLPFAEAETSHVQGSKDSNFFNLMLSKGRKLNRHYHTHKRFVYPGLEKRCFLAKIMFSKHITWKIR